MTEGTRSEDRGPDLIAPPPLLYAGPLLAGFVLDLLLPLPRLSSALRLAGLPFLAAGVIVDRGVIWREERHLEERFGSDYIG